MKKSFNINISGIIFHIDEDAYEKLNAYLERLKSYFSSQEGAGEIVADIESRIAELLREKLGDDKQVINLSDIDELIAIMGEPSEMDDEEAEENQSGTYGFTPSYDRPKRLFRDPDNKIIGGVGGGMGAYFNVDPLWFRLAFVVSFFVVGPLAYIIFWIAIPMARTRVEKLEMRGKKVDINNIERSVKDEFRDIGDNLNTYANRTRDAFSRNKGRYSQTAGDGLLDVLRFLLKVAGVVIGIVLIFTGLSLISSFIGLLFIPSVPFLFVDELPIYFSGKAFIDLLFGGGLEFTLGIIGLILLIGIPIAWLVFIGLRLVFGQRIKTHYFDHNVLIVWLLALFVTAGVGFFTASEFRHTQSVEKEVSALPPATEPYIFSFTPGSWYPDLQGNRLYLFSEVPESKNGLHESFRGIPKISFKTTNDSIGYIAVEYRSRGESPRDASRRAERIVYDIKLNNRDIHIDPLFAIPKSDHFRMQEINIKVFMAEGTQFRISEDMDEIAYPWFINDDELYEVTEGEITEK